MDLKLKIDELAARIEKLKDNVQTEEATKHSFVMPFLSLLGYDIFDPTVVVPEYIADIGRKKGEKVDYAILKDGNPLILIEVKKHSEKLDNHCTQLERYFGPTKSKFAILTNGVEYRFFSDMESINLMDKKPFLVIDLLSIKEREIKQLEKFTKDELNIDKILAMASTQKYVMQIKRIFKEEAEKPGDEFSKFFATKCIDSRMTQQVVDEFKLYIKTAFSDIINDMAADKINALKAKLSIEIDDDMLQSDEEPKDDGIVTTEQELEGYFIIKSILAEIVSVTRVSARDTKSYFGVLLDNNNRKWIGRLHFNAKQKYLGLHVVDKEETKIMLQNVEDIYKYKNELKLIIERLLKSKEES